MTSSPLGVFVGSVFAVALSPAWADDGTLIHAAMLARFERLHNLVVDYEVTTRYTPAIPPEAVVYRNPSGGLNIMNTGTRITRKQFSVLEGRYLYVANDESWDREVQHPDLPEVTPMKKDIYVRASDRCEQFRGDDRGTFTYMGEISDRAPLPGFGELELSLGLRQWWAPDPLTETEIEAMSPTKTDDGKVSLRGLNHEGKADEWLLDPDLGYAPVCYRVYGTEGNEVTIEYRMEDFRPVDGLMLPFEVHGTWRAGPNTVIETTTVAVTAYRFNDPNNTPERYHIDWPEGTRIWDRRAGLGFRATDDALKYIGDNRIAQIALSQISKNSTGEPNGSTVAPSNDSPNAESQPEDRLVVEPNGAKDSVVGVDVSRSKRWLWPGMILFLCAVAAGTLWLRARRPQL